jgi:hypothetical protein
MLFLLPAYILPPCLSPGCVTNCQSGF